MLSSEMRQGGDESAGFEIRCNPISRLLRVRLWGAWQPPLASSYRTEMLASFAELGLEAWDALVDLRRCAPPTGEVAEVRAGLVGRAVEAGMRRIAVCVDAMSTQVQLRRLFERSGVTELAFRDEPHEALRWLHGEDAPLSARRIPIR